MSVRLRPEGSGSRDRPFPGDSHDRPFPEELQGQAAENAGGWVYDVDPGFRPTGSNPTQRIIGAWRIDENGSPTGKFVANAQYRPAPRSRRPRRLILLGGGLLGAILIAGAVVVVILLVSNGSP